MKRRRGSAMFLALMLTFLTVSLTSLIKAADRISEDASVDAESFAKLQSMYSLCDLSVLQFTRDLQTITLTHADGEDWVGAQGAAIYSEALGQIQTSVTKADGRTWTCTRLQDLTDVLGITDPTAIKLLQDCVGTANSQSELSLQLVEDLAFDWTSSECKISKKEVNIPLSEMQVKVHTQRGTNVTELAYTVTGLTLQMEKDATTGDNAVYSIGGTPCIEKEKD